MPRTEFIATAFHVPERVVTNDDLAQLMDTSDEWIVQRSGIKTRYWVSNGETGASLATAAARKALAQAGMRAADLDCIVYCTCTPDHFEPGNGVFLERELGLTDIPAIDVRNQCSGFIYGLSVADAWIRSGQYRRILLVGAEVHSRGLDRTTRGRDTAVLFGDGAGVAILGPTDDPTRSVLSTHLFADGRHAEKLWVDAPRRHGWPRGVQVRLGADAPRRRVRFEDQRLHRRGRPAARAAPGEPAHHRHGATGERAARGPGVHEHSALRQHHRGLDSDRAGRGARRGAPGAGRSARAHGVRLGIHE